MITPEQLEDWLLKRYPGLMVSDAYRERSFFYNPDGSKPKGRYFATIKMSDGPNDKASDLDRDGVYRLSFGLGKEGFIALFGPKPARPPKGGIVDMPHDFHQTNTLVPHPVYAWMGWVCILNPASFDRISEHLDQAYEMLLRKS
ncbi:DUF6194 family protein [Pararhodonellum marinum]|uniref:DUF6194 family protein n=1 Tax=Pararhodonellum marinum TaxID=2755358 RepID=UPI001890B145|nr:DUF6194 family protein [Pararhodonellum marinum]